MSLFRRAWPLVVSAGGALLTMVLFGSAQGGDSIVHYGPLQVTTGTLSAGLGLALRVLAVAVPGVVVFASTDPTDLADALIQNVRAPARFAIGALAAFRLMPLLGDEWRMLTLARRARGIESGRGPWSRLRLFASLSFGLLVGAIRRGTRLATAMDARGFDSGLRRTRAREQHFGGADAALLAMAALLAACLVAISVAAGTFRPVL
jgi:energy-coupling factor transport system permease protein